MRRAASDFFWVPPHVTVVDGDEISVCHSTDPDPLFNQAVPHRLIVDPDPVVQRIRNLHSARSRWWVTEASASPSLLGALAHAGYSQRDRHGAFFVNTEGYALKHPASITARPIRDLQELRELHALRSAIFERPVPTDKQLRLELSQCTGPSARVSRFIAYHKGKPAGTASVTFFDHLNFAFIWAGGVLEKERGHGVYKALLTARAAACQARGIHRMGLYGRLETSAPIVAAHGFERCGLMNYYER